MAEYMPEDWDADRSSADGELVEAPDAARLRPGVWVKVGEPRMLTKPPSS